MEKKYEMVVPTIPRDVKKILMNIGKYFTYLPIKQVVIIGGEGVKKCLPKDERILFFDEAEFVDFNSVKKQIIELSKSKDAGGRTGWYVQQFIKMSYSRVCTEEYYLLWDSDTVPVKTINLFNDQGLPYLDCKTEYHKPYFTTIERLFPGYEKQIDGSFIAEHMFINTKAMNSLLDDIEQNAILEGRSFVEKIINAIDIIELPHSGFSEFETFGTYVCKKYPGQYALRQWKSMRFGGFYFDGAEALKNEDIEWIARKYDAVSFEKGDYLSPVGKLINSSIYRKIFRSGSLEIVSLIIRAYRRIMRKR